jgi:hypothetical protein
MQFMAPSSFWNTPLPPNVALNTADTAKVGAWLQTDAKRAAPYVNTTKYTAAHHVVPPDQPLIPVRLWRASWNGGIPSYATPLRDMLLTGLPIPAGYTPQGDTDDEGSFYMPAWQGVMKNGLVLSGRLYEAWRLRPNTDPNTPHIPWECQWGGRLSGVATSVGHYIDRYTKSGDRIYPYSPSDPVKADLYEEAKWGVMATSLPLYASMIKTADIQAGVIKNAIGLAISTPAAGYRWPAQRSDGTPGATWPVQEGMRLRLPAGYVPAPTLGSFTKLVAIAARDYGFVVVDKSSQTTIRTEPSARPLLGTQSYNALAGFPWASLQVLATGNDFTPNP